MKKGKKNKIRRQYFTIIGNSFVRTTQKYLKPELVIREILVLLLYEQSFIFFQKNIIIPL